MHQPDLPGFSYNADPIGIGGRPDANLAVRVLPAWVACKSFRLVRSGPHEALDFTPWLLQNVDVLSDLLGTDLVLEVAEHPVGDFSLDLKGESPRVCRRLSNL